MDSSSTTASMPSLASICREHLLREKILVVPSLAVGHQIADAVALGGTSWVNLRVETVRTLADGVAGFVIAREGLTVLSRAQALALVEEACDEALDHSPYFAALKDRPGLHRAMQKSIDDLRHAGVSSLPASAFEDPRKAADLRAILAAYEEKLVRGRYVDRFGVLARGISLLEGGARYPAAPDALWLTVEELELTGAEGRFLELVSGGGLLEVGTSGGAGAAAGAAPTGAGEGRPSRLFVFLRADGEENELRGVFRAILDKGRPFDDAEVVYTARDPYLPLAFELTAEYGIPCTFAEGIPAHFTRPGQAVLGFLRWIGGRWDASELQKIARAGTLKLDGIAPAVFARVLRKAAIGWGRDRYRSRLDDEIETLSARVEEDHSAPPRIGIRGHEANQRAVDQARAASLEIGRLLDLSEPVGEGIELDPPAAARVAARFLETFASVRNEIDAMATAGLQRMLGELADIAGRQAPRAEIGARLEEAVRNLHVAASNPKPGFLHIAPVRSGGWSARRQLFIVGADDAKHPGRGLEDPIVLDAERTAINTTLAPGQLPLAGEAPQRASHQFLRLVDRSLSRLISLSYSSLAVKDRREQFPSSAFLDLYRQASRREDVTYAQVERDLPKETFVDARPLSDTEWWLHQRFEGAGRDLLAPLLAAYPMLAAGNEAELARASEALTKWDGLIAAPPEELDPRLNGGIYSASQLEAMARCPYRHFLQRVLWLDVADELIFDPDVWLSALQYGILVHAVLETTMTELCASHQKPSMAFLPRMQEIAEAALLRERRVVPPPGEAAFERQRIELLRSCEVFLRNEEEACRDVTPRYFELSFGFGSSDGMHMPEPLEIPLGAGRSVKVRGKIDRVDFNESTGEWSVWDYKSGSLYGFDDGGRLRCGTKLQYAIYARALEAILRRNGVAGTVRHSGYFFPTPKGRGARFVYECAPGELEQALNLLFDVVGRGYFPHASEAACGDWCVFKTVCGGAKAAAQHTAVKLNSNEDIPSVQAWKNLQEVK
jgi:hypothetical protein